MARFIRFPWATTGDRVEPPFPTDPGGTASYSQGFGPNYELPNTDPNYEPVPRDLTNGLYYDLTDNIRQYQLNGSPDWHPATDNGGVAINYPINALVRWNDTLYRSIIANNTVEPGTDPASWAELSAFQIATNAEVQAGASTSKIVTPAGLASRTATTTRTGLIEIATNAEVAAGLSSSLAVVPSALAALLPFRGTEFYATAGTYTWTVPDGVTKALVIVTGGGGAGGRVTSGAGGGGGGGGTSIALVDLTGVTSVAVTVGAGGARAGAGVTPGSGGTSSFGAFCSATGGTGGGAVSRGGGFGGVGSGGALNLTGGGGGSAAKGGVANTDNYACGSGGSSLWGGGAPGSSQDSSLDTTSGVNGGGGAGGIIGGFAGTGGAGVVAIFY